MSLIFIEVFLRVGGFIYNAIYKVPQYKDSSDIIIFCVGESTTFGVGADNPIIQAYPYQLERMLNNEFQDLSIQCLFDRTIGINTSEILIKLPLYFEKYNPDLVIFMVGVNNWWNLNKANPLLFSKNRFISKSTLKILVFLDHFRVWKLIKWIGYSKELINFSSGFYPSNDPKVNESADEVEVKKRTKKIQELLRSLLNKYGEEVFNISYKIAEQDIRAMIKICKNNEIKVIVCNYPVKHRGNIGQIQRKIAKELNVLFVDNRLFFEKIPDKKEYFSYDGWHPNTKGYKIIAQNIFRCILDNKLIE